MRNTSEADVESADRLSSIKVEAEPSVASFSDRPAGSSGAPGRPVTNVPFVPTGVSDASTAEPRPSLMARVATSRWRRPLMVVLAVAVAGSAVLAARRGATSGEGGRTSGAISDSAVGAGVTGDDSMAADGAGIDAGGAGEVAVQPLNDDVTANTDGASAGDAEISSRDVEPLEVSAPASPTTAVSVPSTSATSTRQQATTSAVSTTTSTTASTSTSASAEGSGGRPTGSPGTTEAPTTTRPSTTRPSTTTTAAPTTAAPTTTPTTLRSVVLINSSGGGFERPAIDDEMVWLSNGDVGSWRSTNGDIQLMRSGFEGIQSVDGGQFAELNSSSQGGLYQTLVVEPGTVVEWEFLHRARSGRERIEVRVGATSGTETIATVEATTQWVGQSGRWRVPQGVTSIRFTLWSTETGYYGNLIDAVRVTATG